MNFMLLRETFGMAGRALVANRMRSFLALLGIVIGVGTVIGMVALINGFQRSFRQSIQSFGNNTIYIRRIRPGIQFNGDVPDSLKQRRAFKIEDAEAILDRCPSVKAIAPFKWSFTDITLTYRGRTARSTFTYGTNENYLITHGYDLARGRFFTSEEVNRRDNVVVLGKDTREALFKDGSGLGERVHLNGIPFTVIGEFEKKGRMLGENFDLVAAIPYTTIDKYFPVPQEAPIWFPKRGELFLDAIAVSPEMSDQAQREIIDVLRLRRHLPSNKNNDFVVFTDDAFLSLYNAVTGGIFAVMALVSTISLMVGGIGVMNIMLVAVTERTREIGIRKAVGARRSDILIQFLVEAVLVSFFGGIAGVQPVIAPYSIALAFGAAVLIGLFFGTYPAGRAAAMRPIEALRFE